MSETKLDTKCPSSFDSESDHEVAEIIARNNKQRRRGSMEHKEAQPGHWFDPRDKEPKFRGSNSPVVSVNDTGDSPRFQANRESKMLEAAEDERQRKLASINAIDPRSIVRRAPRQLVQCRVVRNRAGLHRLYPQYRMYLQCRGGEEREVLGAQKHNKSKTANYHIFDLTRGYVGDGFNKKNGNYMGKMKSNFNKSENTMFLLRGYDGASGRAVRERREVGCVMFETLSVLKKIAEGMKPRSIQVGLPEVDEGGAEVDHGVPQVDMLARLREDRLHGCATLECKEPVQTPDGTYRLHFGGRVTTASVKNFQLVDCADAAAAGNAQARVVMQFGKVSADEFHLDFAHPLNAFQAFCVALSQFNY